MRRLTIFKKLYQNDANVVGNTRVNVYPSHEKMTFPIRKDDISTEKDPRREDI